MGLCPIPYKGTAFPDPFISLRDGLKKGLQPALKRLEELRAAPFAAGADGIAGNAELEFQTVGERDGQSLLPGGRICRLERRVVEQHSRRVVCRVADQCAHAGERQFRNLTADGECVFQPLSAGPLPA